MNPYTILKIKHDAGKAEILQAVARALRERKFSAKEIAIAQKELLNPVSRAMCHFLNHLDLKTYYDQFKPEQTPTRKRKGPTLKYLSLFGDDDEE
ncbi:hypothetical protein ACFL27_15470 [candidate division CSSED10-310 bacterium]|uniref:Uncharacterized protein n=1 Tax=candidate division CSSED10-310 bacterium TaxID=2855610 RepID=A0ABV6YZF9_UNCC1